MDVKDLIEQIGDEYENLFQDYERVKEALRAIFREYEAIIEHKSGLTTGFAQTILDARTAMGFGPRFRLLQHVRVKDRPGVRSDFIDKTGWIEQIRPLRPQYAADTLKWVTHKDGYVYYLMCDDSKPRSGFSCDDLELIEHVER